MPPRRRASAPAKTAIRPLTPDRWPDLVKLFGPRGACASCWCTWWRLTKPEFVAGQGGGNRREQERYVKAGHVPGLLAYAGGEPVGWVAIEPRSAYARLGRSRTLAPVDDRPVWSITCFFVAREHRGRGLTRTLIEAAVRYARSRGARIVEAYPVDPGREVADAVVYHGAASTFRALGFEEVARRSRTRPIVRKKARAAPTAAAPTESSAAPTESSAAPTESSAAPTESSREPRPRVPESPDREPRPRVPGPRMTDSDSHVRGGMANDGGEHAAPWTRGP